MQLLDLCAGLGGFSLAADWMGWQTAAFCEIDKFCQKVLAKNFPGVPIYDDLFTFPSESFRGQIDILTAGFPCQPFSAAGKRKGKDDDRHIFPKILEIVGIVRPTVCVFENVRGLLSIADGDVFEEIAASLEGIGYEVATFCIPACAVDAPHRRDRLWIVAHANSERERAGHREIQETNGEISERHNDAESSNAEKRVAHNAERAGRSGRTGGITTVADSDRANDGLSEPTDCDVADTDNSGNRTRQPDTHAKRRPLGGERQQSQPELGRHGSDVADATEPRLPIPGQAGVGQLQAEEGSGIHDRFEQPNLDASNAGNAGLQGNKLGRAFIERSGPPRSVTERFENEGWLEAASRFCRVDDVVPNRVDRLKSLGNSVAPLLVYQIFAAIEAAENER